jgi:hypothetical protein
MITVIKLGPASRRFTVEDRETGRSLFDQTVAPGTAIIMTLEANLLTKHAVPECVDECGLSGSIVLRSISEHVTWDRLEKKLAQMDARDARLASSAVSATSKGTKRRHGD